MWSLFPPRSTSSLLLRKSPYCSDFILILSGAVQIVEGIPIDVSVGQVVWAPQVTAASPDLAEKRVKKTLVFVGWSSFSSNFNTQRKLGMVYCHNKPCYLYAVEAPVPDRYVQYWEEHYLSGVYLLFRIQYFHIKLSFVAWTGLSCAFDELLFSRSLLSNHECCVPENARFLLHQLSG